MFQLGPATTKGATLTSHLFQGGEVASSDGFFIIYKFHQLFDCVPKICHFIEDPNEISRRALDSLAIVVTVRYNGTADLRDCDEAGNHTEGIHLLIGEPIAVGNTMRIIVLFSDPAKVDGQCYSMELSRRPTSIATCAIFL